MTFKSGSTSLGNGALNGSGVATLSTAALPEGIDSVTAAYAAAGNFAASTSPATKITVKGRNADHHICVHRKQALRELALYGKSEFQRRQQLSGHHYGRIWSGGHQRGQGRPHRRRHDRAEGRASR